MPLVTKEDLENAALDLEHVAELVTGVNAAGTPIIQSTDRLGQVKLVINELLRRFGHESPISYASGIVIERRSQTVSYDVGGGLGLQQWSWTGTLPHTTTGLAGDLPGTNVDWFSIIAPNLGTAAELDTGTGAGQLPTNGDLGSASLVDVGASGTEIQLNSDNLTLFLSRVGGATGATKLPTGTTAQRPSSPTEGMVRVNTTLGVVEAFILSAWISLAGGGGTGPTTVQLGENALAVNNGDVIAPFTGADIGSLTVGTGELELIGSGSRVHMPIRSIGNENLITYGSIRSDVTANWSTVRLTHANLADTVLFFNFNIATNTRQAGALSIRTRDSGGATVASTTIATGLDFTSNFKFVLEWHRSTNNGDAFVSVYNDNGADLELIGTATTSGGTGSTASRISEVNLVTDTSAFAGTLFIQYLQASRPNFTSIGDSIAAGHNSHDPDPSMYAGVDDYGSSWQSSLRTAIKAAHPTLRNNFVANHGVGGNTSTEILARLNEALDDSAKVFIYGGPNNDFGEPIGFGKRNDNIGQALSRAKATGALTVHLGAIVPNSASGNFPDNAAYYDDWNENYSDLGSSDIFVDIMESGIRQAGERYISTSFATDGTHPNSAGYGLIGAYIGAQISSLITLE